MYMQRSVAQLPPKSPNSATALNYWLPRRHPSAAMLAAAQQPHSWIVDEFLDFSATRRGYRRRSASDSVAFLVEKPCGFDRLVDEEQLMSLFPDELVPASPQSPSSTSPSDHNSVNKEKTTPAPEAGIEESQSTCEAEAEAARSGQPTVDHKRVKRILANRQSAQRSRVRKLQYVAELERSVTSLQSEVSALSPRVAFLDHQRSILTTGNSHLKQRIAALEQERIFKDAHQGALKKEIERLRRVYEERNLDKNHKMTANSEPGDCVCMY